MKMQLQNVVWKEDAFFVAQCLNVDISSFGDTKEEALQNLSEALELYFEDASSTDINNVENPEVFTTELEHA